MSRSVDTVAPTEQTPLLEGEEITRHSGTAEEESHGMLANVTGGSAASSTTGSATASTLRDIVRASARLRLDLADLAIDRLEHIKRRCGGIEGDCPACTARQRLFDAQRACVTALNASTRFCWRIDADTYDACMVAHGRPPKGVEWKPNRDRALAVLRSVIPGAKNGESKIVADQLINTNGNLYTYPLVRMLAPALSSHICATLARNAERSWGQVRFEALVRQTKSPPHYAGTAPIPIPAASVRVARDGERYLFCFSLRSGRHPDGHEYRWPVKAYDRHVKSILEGMLGKSLQMGQVTIEQDRLRPGKWYVRFAYTKQVQMVTGSERAVGINRGMVCFLVALGTDGKRWLYDGNDIVSYLKQMQRRRQDYQRDSKVSERWGHGLKRTIAPVLVLSGKAERWRATKCQTIARNFAQWVHEEGYTVVYLEDFKGIRDSIPEKLQGGKRIWDLIQEWPYYQLGSRIVSCLEEVGIRVEIVPSEGISQTCPKCGHRDVANIQLRRRLFCCTACAHKEHLDVAAARNALARGASGEVVGSEDPNDPGKKPNGKKAKNGAARRASGKSLKTKK